MPLGVVFYLRVGAFRKSLSGSMCVTLNIYTHTSKSQVTKKVPPKEVPGFVGASTQTHTNTLQLPEGERRMRMSETHTHTDTHAPTKHTHTHTHMSDADFDSY